MNSFLIEFGLDIIPKGECHLNRGVYSIFSFFGFKLFSSSDSFINKFFFGSPLINSLARSLISKYNKSRGKSFDILNFLFEKKDIFFFWGKILLLSLFSLFSSSLLVILLSSELFLFSSLLLLAFTDFSFCSSLLIFSLLLFSSFSLFSIVSFLLNKELFFV